MTDVAEGNPQLGAAAAITKVLTALGLMLAPRTNRPVVPCVKQSALRFLLARTRCLPTFIWAATYLLAALIT